MQETQNFEYVVEEKDGGARLDKVMAVYMPDVSRSYLQKLIKDGCVSVNGTVCDSKKEKVSAGDTLCVELPPLQELEVKPEKIPLDIVYEDEDVLVVNKPKGMVVHPAPGNDSGTLVNAIMYHCGDSLSSINGVVRPGIVHRIDKDTSGLLMIAKNNKAHHCLADQLAEHSSTRAYLAVVYNSFSEEEGTVDEPIGRDPSNRLRQAITDKNGRHAVTHYKVVEPLGKYTLIEARLETGRTHQIRVHMKHIGHPLLGDDVYGPKKNPFHIHGQMLHAYLLGFIHPTTGEYMEFEAPIPEDFKKVLDRIRTVELG